MANFSSLQTLVQNRLIDVQAVTTSEIPALINKALRKLQAKHNFQVMEAWTSFTTTVNTRLLGTMPADFKELRRTHPFYVDSTGNPVQMFMQPTLEAILDRYGFSDTTDTGYPHDLLLLPQDTGGGNAEESGPTVQVQVFPYPDGNSLYVGGSTVPAVVQGQAAITVPAGEYPIFVPYWKYLPDLSAASDQNWFTDNAEDFLVDAATAEGFFLNWDEQRGMFWHKRAWGSGEDTNALGGEAARVVRLDKARRMGPVSTLRIRPDVLGRRGMFRNPFTQVPGE